MRNIDRVNKILQEFATLTLEEQAQVADDLNKEIDALMKEPNRATSKDFAQTNEEAPIGTLTRMALKGLMVHPHDAVKKLEADKPEFDFMYDESGNIFAREKKAKEGTGWSPVDKPTNPLQAMKSLEGWKEMGADVLDVPVDLAKGAIGTVGSALGGVLGAAAGGAGALPGAAVGGAMASGAAETGRQALSQMLGWSKGFDPKSIAIDTGVGAAAPVLLGTGLGVIGSLPSKIGAGVGLKMQPKALDMMRDQIAKATGIAAEEVATWSQDQVLKEAGKLFKYGGTLPKVISSVGDVVRGSGASSEISKDTIRHMTDNKMLTSKLQVEPMAEKFADRLLTFAKDKQREAGKEIDQALVGKKVNVRGVIQSLQDAANEPFNVLKTTTPGTQAHSSASDTLKTISDVVVNISKSAKNDQVNPKQVTRIRSWLTDLADYNAAQGVGGQPITNSAKATTQQAGRSAKEALNEAIKAVGGGKAINNYEKAASNMRTIVNEVASDVAGNNKPSADKVRSMLSGKWGSNPVDRIAKDTMQPESFKRYLKHKNALKANIEYLGATGESSGILGIPLTRVSNKKSADYAANALKVGKVTSPITKHLSKLGGNPALEGYMESAPMGPGSQEEINNLRMAADPYVQGKLEEYIKALGGKR